MFRDGMMMVLTMDPNAEDSLATRASLVARLRDWGDADSWGDFSRTYGRLIMGVARKAGLTESECQDVQQEVLLSVAKSIATFDPKRESGSFKAWLLNLTRWRIADQLRRRNALPPSGAAESTATGETAIIERVPDPAGMVDRVWDEEWRAAAMEVALGRVRRRARPKHFQIFELYALRNWDAARVARELDVTRVQVYLVHHRLSGWMKEEIARLEERGH